MYCLIAETVALKPHLETAGELALSLRDDGHEVVYAWLGDALPWSDWHLPFAARLLGGSLAKRERCFARLLEREGVALAQPVRPDPERLKRAHHWAQAFKGDMNMLKEVAFEGAPLGMGAASSLISLSGNSAYDPGAHVAQTRACLESAAVVYERARALIERRRPDRIITFNGRFATCKPIIAAAEQAGIPVLRHERGSTFERYELFSDALHDFAYIRDRIDRAWNDAASPGREQAGHEFFKRRRQGDGIGWHSFVNAQAQGQVPERDQGRRRVVYFSSSDDEYAAISDTVTPGNWGDQLRAVEALIRVCSHLADVELLIRVHPHLSAKSASERERWAAMAGGQARLIPAESKVDSYALLDSADVVVTYGSTIGMEAAYWGKPSILLGPSTYTGNGVCKEPESETQLLQMLAAPGNLPIPRREGCLPYGHYYMTYGRPYQYYQPMSLSEGRFLGDELSWDSPITRVLRQAGMESVYNWIRRRTR